MNISIFNLNCWLFPTPLSTDCYLRLDRIIEMIEARDPDIITLQEVWSNKYISYLKEKLPSYFFIHSKTPFFNQSGLLILLKHEPANYKVNFFKASSHLNFTDFFLRKGYISLDMEIKGEKWTILNTHLYSAFSKIDKVVTENEFIEVMASIPETNVILCGDFNFEVDKFNELNQEKFSQICDSQITFADTSNPYAYQRFNVLMAKNKKIDYMLYRSPLILNSQYEVVKSPFVSDHYPMYAKITL